MSSWTGCDSCHRLHLLHRAARSRVAALLGHRFIRTLSRAQGADVRGEFGATALIRASEQGHPGIVTLLLNVGVDVNAQDDNGDSALLWTCRMGHASVASLLLGAGADAGLCNKQVLPPLACSGHAARPLTMALIESQRKPGVA